jgi:hypothetical protein
LIAAVLRHTDSTMVERVYGRLEPELFASRLRQSLGVESQSECNAGVTDTKEIGAQKRHMEWWNELPTPGSTKKLNHQSIREKKLV